MRAAVLEQVGQLVVKEVPMPHRDDQSAVVQVKACGVCGSDLERVMHKGTYHFPTIPGHEFAGVIEQGCDDFAQGERVVVAPIMPCKTCESCRSGFYGQCENYNFLGSRCDGGFAEYVKVPQENILPLPDSISFPEAAVIEPAAVTLHGVRKLNINVDDVVTVLGCGALGLLAVQLAKIMGASVVIAVDIKAKNLELATQLGADYVVNSRTEDLPQRLAQLSKRGVSVVIETAGVASVQAQAIELVKPQGRILYLGTAHADVVLPPTVFEKIIRNELALLGSWNSYSADFPGADWRSIINLIAQGRLDVKTLTSHCVTMRELPEVIAKMYQREMEYTKVVMLNQ